MPSDWSGLYCDGHAVSSLPNAVKDMGEVANRELTHNSFCSATPRPYQFCKFPSDCFSIWSRYLVTSLRVWPKYSSSAMKLTLHTDSWPISQNGLKFVVVSDQNVFNEIHLSLSLRRYSLGNLGSHPGEACFTKRMLHVSCASLFMMKALDGKFVTLQGFLLFPHTLAPSLRLRVRSLIKHQRAPTCTNTRALAIQWRELSLSLVIS